LTCSTVAQSSSVSRSNSCGAIAVGVPGVPALFTRKSSRPRSPTARSTIRTASAASPTLPGAAMTRLPVSAASRSTASAPRASPSRWLIATAQPPRASMVAVARPMPDAPPVTSAARPFRS
jgi:hypothetical protein